MLATGSLAPNLDKVCERRREALAVRCSSSLMVFTPRELGAVPGIGALGSVAVAAGARA
jgi:hypothetical protein